MVAAAVGAGEVLAHLDDQQPVGVGGRPAASRRRWRRRGATGSRGRRRRAGAPAVIITRGASAVEDRHEAAEVGRREADVGAAVAQQPLERAVEPAQVVDVRVGEEVGEHA